MTEFAVATLALETRSVLERFIRHYKRLGAAEITVYYDGPSDAVADLADETVRILTCDTAFWDAHGCRDRPIFLDQKLLAAFGDALATTSRDWVLLVDADEFLMSPIPFVDVLARIPAGTDAVSIPNAEAVWGPGDVLGAEFGATHFRWPERRRLHRRIQQAVYGAQLCQLLQKGLAGHAAGKQVLRAGARFDGMTSHVVQREGQIANVRLDTVLPGAGTYIAHFDAISLDRWREKFRRRYSGETPSDQMGPGREKQMQLLRDTANADDAAVAALFRKLYRLSSVQYTLLRTAGLAFQHDTFSV